jgi:hypothetical protein
MNRHLAAATSRLFAILVIVLTCPPVHAQSDRPADDNGFDGPQVSDSGVGYIDSAILGNQVRMRFESAYNNSQPARAEFVWPVDGPFGPGPGPETRVDVQEFSLFMESMVGDRWSVFGELPVRFLNPEIQDNTAGIGDLHAGVKYALSASADCATTLQLRTYLPTADATRGLGTGHVSLEPSLLWYRRASDRLTFEAERRQ